MSIARGGNDGGDLKEQIEAEYAREDEEISEENEEMTFSLIYTVTCFYCD